jgi:hypothetical protein
MSFSIFRRKMKTCSSILEKLNCRSATGLYLGLDVHRHPDNLIPLFWNTHNFTGCYRNFIARHTSDAHVQYQVKKLFASGGLVVACRCCYPTMHYLAGEHGKLYIFGRPRIGKTFIDEQACKNLGFSKFYLPVPRNFFFAT